MSDKIRRVALNLVRSQSFLDTMTNLVAAELERQLRAEAGGEYIYVAKFCKKADRETRNELIRSRFTGNNWAELSKDFGMTPRNLRNICSKKVK